MNMWCKCRLLLVCLSVLAGNVERATSAICEPIRIPMCHWLPYNLTRMPNLLFHSAQRNAKLVIEQYQPLVDTKCSDDLLFFLCSMFAPMCPMGFRQDIIPPCRGVCEKARMGCEPVLLRYNLTWPKGLKCDNLPMYDRGVCISPESIVATSNEGQSSSNGDSHQLPQITPPNCDCPENEPEKLKEVFTSGKYHYAMMATYRYTEQLPDGGFILHVSPGMLFYHRRVGIPRAEARLWVDTDCLCTKLKENHSYLFMGKEDRMLQRLLLGRESYVDKWRDKTKKRLKKWQRKLVKTRYRKRHIERSKETSEQPVNNAHATRTRGSERRHKKTRV